MGIFFFIFQNFFSLENFSFDFHPSCCHVASQRQRSCAIQPQNFDQTLDSGHELTVPFRSKHNILKETSTEGESSLLNPLIPIRIHKTRWNYKCSGNGFESRPSFERRLTKFDLSKFLCHFIGATGASWDP